MSTTINNFGVLNYYDHHKEYNIDARGKDLASVLCACEAEDIIATNVTTQPDATRKRGPRSKSLFADDAIALQEKKRLLDFLHQHHFGGSEFDSAEDNSCNQIAVCFFRQWNKRQLLNPKVSGTALMRFLKDECMLPVTVDERAFGNALAKMISSDHLYPDWCGEVSECFSE